MSAESLSLALKRCGVSASEAATSMALAVRRIFDADAPPARPSEDSTP